MKSRREYFNLRRALLFGAFALYALSFFLFQMCFLVKDHSVSILVVMSFALMFAVICHVLGRRNSEYLFCPQCGSKKIVKNTLFGIPAEITCDCPDCGAKIDLDKPVNKD